jgi:hypothetical protein
MAALNKKALMKHVKQAEKADDKPVKPKPVKEVLKPLYEHTYKQIMMIRAIFEQEEIERQLQMVETLFERDRSSFTTHEYPEELKKEITRFIQDRTLFQNVLDYLSRHKMLNPYLLNRGLLNRSKTIEYHALKEKIDSLGKMVANIKEFYAKKKTKNVPVEHFKEMNTKSYEVVEKENITDDKLVNLIEESLHDIYEKTEGEDNEQTERLKRRLETITELATARKNLKILDAQLFKKTSMSETAKKFLKKADEHAKNKKKDFKLDEDTVFPSYLVLDMIEYLYQEDKKDDAELFEDDSELFEDSAEKKALLENIEPLRKKWDEIKESMGIPLSTTERRVEIFTKGVSEQTAHAYRDSAVQQQMDDRYVAADILKNRPLSSKHDYEYANRSPVYVRILPDERFQDDLDRVTKLISSLYPSYQPLHIEVLAESDDGNGYALVYMADEKSVEQYAITYGPRKKPTMSRNTTTSSQWIEDNEKYICMSIDDFVDHESSVVADGRIYFKAKPAFFKLIKGLEQTPTSAGVKVRVDNIFTTFEMMITGDDLFTYHPPVKNLNKEWASQPLPLPVPKPKQRNLIFDSLSEFGFSK